MRYLQYIIIIALLFSINKLYSQSKSDCSSIAEKSISWIQNNHADSLVNHFSDEVAAKLDEKTIASIWKQLESGYGDFLSIGETNFTKNNDALIIDQILKFKNAALKYRLNFNADNKISGIFFIPFRTARSGTDQGEYFTETQCFFTNDEIEFPAMLCSPKNRKAKAVVILVHGSGPNDMDETIGPNKIFKQIANKLAKYGIASLRYDKRTYLIQQGRIKNKSNLDINNIVIDDAVAAAEFIHSVDSLSDLPRIIIGHSMGALVAPEIARRSGSVDAIIMMAANARPLEDLVLEQYKYLYAVDGYTKEEKKEIKAIKKKVKNVKKLKKYVAKGKTVDLPLTNDVDFWMSLINYNQLQTINNLQKPVLILQGSRDYQVRRKDFNLWYSNSKEAIHHDQSFILYSNLNHLFMYTKGCSYPSDYNKKAEISSVVIKDIADWINNIWDVNNSASKLKRGLIYVRKP